MAPLFPRLADPDGGVAIRAAEASLSYRELAGAAAALATRLEGLERAAVWAEPRLETCVAVVAGLAAGVAVVPLDPRAAPAELAHVVADSAPAAVLAARGVPLPPAVAGLERIDVTASGRGALPDALGAADTAIVLYTSGTTGPPKGVLIPRRAIESNLDALADAWGWTAADGLVHALPLFHAHGLVLGVLGPLRRGGSLELVGRFSPEGLAAALGRGGTMAFTVPTMVRRISLELERDPALARPFRGARLVVSGSAALPAAEHRRFERLTGQRIVERYGMTETLMIASVRADGERRPGHVGPPLPGVEVRLVGDEVQVRGPSLFTGYLGRPEATAAAFDRGWFRTGDLGVRAPDGYLRLLGRLSTDLIKSGGYRIGAGEVEAALLEHPGVAEAAVAGRPDDDLGERVVAWVVRAPGAELAAGELLAHAAARLAAHKCPRDVRFVTGLPRNAMGKVLKKELPP